MSKFLTAIMAVFFMFAVTGCGDDADCNAGTSDAQSESDVAAVTPEDVVASEGEGEGEGESPDTDTDTSDSSDESNNDDTDSEEEEEQE